MKSPKMRTALVDLDLEHLFVVSPGERAYELAEQVSVVPLALLPRVLTQRRLM